MATLEDTLGIKDLELKFLGSSCCDVVSSSNCSGGTLGHDNFIESAPTRATTRFLKKTALLNEPEKDILRSTTNLPGGRLLSCTPVPTVIPNDVTPHNKSDPSLDDVNSNISYIGRTLRTFRPVTSSRIHSAATDSASTPCLVSGLPAGALDVT